MMMRMLAAGGMPALVDHVREADEDNPKGYYEFEQVKNIRQDDTWLDMAAGKVVKMVSMLLYNLPSGRKYKVVFMRRNMTEILMSQRAMLARSGQGKDFDDADMGALFSRHLKEIEQWLAKQNNFEVFYAAYNEVMANPRHYAHQLNLFMHNALNEEKMVQVVDSALYRIHSDRDRHAVEPLSPLADDADKQTRSEHQRRSLGYM
jgi:hypothetical protein